MAVAEIRAPGDYTGSYPGLEKLKPLCAAVAQVAIQTIFVFANLLIATVVFPVAFQAVLLPSVALGSVFLAAHFYLPKTVELTVAVVSQEEPMIAAPPPPRPLSVPVGLTNEGGKDCAITATLQFLLADPQMAHWLHAQPPFTALLESYDRGGGPIPGSHAIRNLSLSPEGQLDASQVMTAILRALPPALQVRKEILRHLQGDPELLYPLYPQAVSESFMILNMEPEAENFQEMLNRNLDARPNNPYRAQGKDHLVHKYVIDREEVRILAVPSALRFQIARFRSEPRRFLFWGPRNEKRSDPVPIPPEITVPIAGELKRYQLASFVHHEGASSNSGHYIAGRIMNGVKYLIDDDQVTIAEEGEWDRLLSQAYLVSFLPI